MSYNTHFIQVGGDLDCGEPLGECYLGIHDDIGLDPSSYTLFRPSSYGPRWLGARGDGGPPNLRHKTQPLMCERSIVSSQTRS